jgi:hypothetical protein
MFYQLTYYKIKTDKIILELMDEEIEFLFTK